MSAAEVERYNRKTADSCLVFEKQDKEVLSLVPCFGMNYVDRKRCNQSKAHRFIKPQTSDTEKEEQWNAPDFLMCASEQAI